MIAAARPRPSCRARRPRPEGSDPDPAPAASVKPVGIENPVHLLFIAIVALLVLGPKRLPALARALGKGVREFREAISTDTTATPTEPQLGPSRRRRSTARRDRTILVRSARLARVARCA